MVVNVAVVGTEQGGGNIGAARRDIFVRYIHIYVHQYSIHTIRTKPGIFLLSYRVQQGGTRSPRRWIFRKPAVFPGLATGCRRGRWILAHLRLRAARVCVRGQAPCSGATQRQQPPGGAYLLESGDIMSNSCLVSLGVVVTYGCCAPPNCWDAKDQTTK